jgi:hypothetical protein
MRTALLRLAALAAAALMLAGCSMPKGHAYGGTGQGTGLSNPYRHFP